MVRFVNRCVLEHALRCRAVSAQVDGGEIRTHSVAKVKRSFSDRLMRRNSSKRKGSFRVD